MPEPKPDPRGSPETEDYIKHLEFFNQELRRDNMELRIKLYESRPKVVLRKTLAVVLYTYLWIPLRIIKWSDDREARQLKLQNS